MCVIASFILKIISIAVIYPHLQKTRNIILPKKRGGEYLSTPEPPQFHSIFYLTKTNPSLNLLSFKDRPSCSILFRVSLDSTLPSIYSLLIQTLKHINSKNQLKRRKRAHTLGMHAHTLLLVNGVSPVFRQAQLWVP